jgi:hypothetical protein
VEAELQYIFNTASIFGEARMTTDPWDTTADGLYIVASVRATSATGVDFSNLYYSTIFIKISASSMTLLKYGYFNLATDYTGYDLFVSRAYAPTDPNHYLLVFGRIRLSTSGSWQYQPYLMKLASSDFSLKG